MSWSGIRPLILLQVAAAVAAAGVNAAQAPAPEAWVIRNARVIVRPGEVLPQASVVVRDGRIAEVGSAVSAPAGARELDATGLTLHAGLIDLATTLGQPESVPSGQGPQNPPAPNLSTPEGHLRAVAQGITPAWKVGTVVKPEGSRVEDGRNSGVTLALSLPQTGAMPGQAGLLRTAAGPAAPPEPSPVCIQFRGGPGRYPGTLMAILAAQRQQLADAARYRELLARQPQPTRDPNAEALVPALERKEPALFLASREREIRRALLLAREFGIRPVIVGGEEAHRVVPELKAAGAAVLYGLGNVGATPPEQRADPATAPRALLDAGVPVALTTQLLGGYTGFRLRLVRVIAGGLTPDQALELLTTAPARILGIDSWTGEVAAGKEANLVLFEGDPFAPGQKIRRVFVAGVPHEVPAESQVAPASGETRVGSPVLTTRTASPGPGTVLIRGGTVLTVSGGTIPNGSVWIVDGKIRAVGPAGEVNPPPGTPVIDATGKYVMPGIVDAHSHMAIEGGINEGTYSLTPEVRIRECINPRDVSIYRALAGGVTTIHAMHGSANTIGGQNAQLKLKWGASADEMLIPDAPRTVKFALGENPKRSNSTPQPNTPQRYPATRMGVEFLLRDGFTAARAYKASWAAYEKARSEGRNPIPPRRDLRLEALAEIMDGKILVEAHSYRSDEILMLLRLAEEFGFRIRCLHHALEAYKVAPEIARHGAGVSTFADFWGYKVEAYDAIPHNMALCARAGIRVSVNSDSNERVRRMYWEAARGMKFGGMSEQEALKLITLNPAWQIGVDHRIGSLEPGKDGDVAIFSAHPFAASTMCEMTLIEGRVYFDRKKDLAERGKPGYPGGEAEGTLNIGSDHECACDHIEYVR